MAIESISKLQYDTKGTNDLGLCAKHDGIYESFTVYDCQLKGESIEQRTTCLDHFLFRHTIYQPEQ